jgi:hypothetical protein
VKPPVLIALQVVLLVLLALAALPAALMTKR